MTVRLLVCLAMAAGLVSGQVQLQFPQFGATGYSRVLTLANGSPLLVGTKTNQYGDLQTNGQFKTGIGIALSGIGLALFRGGLAAGSLAVLGGRGSDIPADAAVDPFGNVWIVGSTTSDDFNLVNPIVATKVPYRTAAFVVELDPTGVKILFASYLCGQIPNIGPDANSAYVGGASYATHIAFDLAGNAYVAGSTNEADFPLTPGSLQTKPGIGNLYLNSYSVAFVTKISAAGKLIFGASLAGRAQGCATGGSSCLEHDSTYNTVNSMFVDVFGNVTVAGGLYSTGYVSRLSADGTKLIWSMVGTFGFPAVRSVFAAPDPSGNVYLFGVYLAAGSNPYFLSGVPGLFAGKLRADGTSLIYTTDLGLSADAQAYGIVVDSAGNAYMAGTSSSPQFPSIANVPQLGADFLLQLDVSATKPQYELRFPAGTVTQPPAIDTNGNVLLLASQGSLLSVSPATALTKPGIAAFSNAASYVVNTGFTPGEIVSAFGFNLATAPLSGAPDASGKFPTVLGGVQVLVLGMPVPLLYVGPNQINFQAPFLFSLYYEPSVQVVTPAGKFTATVPPSALAVGLFTSGAGGFAAALNQDGTVNSTNNPAQLGSIVSLFGTGLEWPSGLTDGMVATGALDIRPEQRRMQVLDAAFATGEILYCGAAPGLIDGVFQVNVQLPFGELPGTQMLTLTSTASSGTLSSNAVKIYTK